MNVFSLISNFKKDGTQVLKELSRVEYTKLLSALNDAYYNSSPLVSDNEYDIIHDLFQTKFPASPLVVGSATAVKGGGSKAALPYLMASMDKIKPDSNTLSTWKTTFTGPYILSCKLDGVSGLYSTEGEIPQLFTRGDGKVGQNISHLIPFLKLPLERNVVVRGEFLISKAVFQHKYKDEFANSRNLVAGILNKKGLDVSKMGDVRFVCYEVIKPTLKPSQQMEFLAGHQFQCVKHKLTKELNNDLLSTYLLQMRSSHEYDIDGIIVADDKVYDRPNFLMNPNWAFAFKMVLSEQIAEAHVVDVIWTASKDGYLKPRVQILPIQLGGVCIEFATGFNAAFIRDNKIGIGAIIEIIRSGDVIPHIRSVTSAATCAKMPSSGSYAWNETNVDIILVNPDSDLVVREKVVAGFFKQLEVEGLGEGNVGRLMEVGFDTISKILHMSVADFLKVDGFKITMATKIHQGIQERVLLASLNTLMAASNLFGRGLSIKKIEMIMEACPQMLTSLAGRSDKLKQLLLVKGIAEKTAELFLSNIPVFIEFLKECGLEGKLGGVLKKEETGGHVLFNKTVVITGFRDKDLEEKLKSVGGKMGTGVNKNTFVLIVKTWSEHETSTKFVDAKKLGIEIMPLDVFKIKYL
jgi:NAD-dependent DNA ligase